MDEKVNEPIKPKKTSASARHLRRKRYNEARKAETKSIKKINKLETQQNISNYRQKRIEIDSDVIYKIRQQFFIAQMYRVATSVIGFNTIKSDIIKQIMQNDNKPKEEIKIEGQARLSAREFLKLKNIDDKKSDEIEKDENVINNTSIVKNLNDDQLQAESVTKELKNLSLKESEKLPVKLPDNLSVNLPVIKNEEKSKSELRAERRAKQNAQRAAKKLGLNKKIPNLPSQAITSFKNIQDITKKIKKSDNTNVKENKHEINLFKHLYHEQINLPAVNSNIHPAIIRLGVKYANKIIVGSNARCIAFLAALKQLIKDYERPSQADFTRGLETSLQESMAYLNHCRPPAVSMLNALKHLKWKMTQLSDQISDEEARNKLDNDIDLYINEQILLADEAISIKIRTKIYDNDVILTYGYSSLIQKIICDAYDVGRKFHVIIADGRPWLEGKELLKRLAKHGVSCSYLLINALSFVMPEVNKVFLGAHAILANGAVMSRAGTAQVALMAKAFNVPVLFACETHKSCERVQTDSIVYNEIGNADELTQNLTTTIINDDSSIINWRDIKSLNLLNIMYDVTPADLVTAVVTELAILPCTSVPVILRIKPSEI